MARTTKKTTVNAPEAKRSFLVLTRENDYDDLSHCSCSRVHSTYEQALADAEKHMNEPYSDYLEAVVVEVVSTTRRKGLVTTPGMAED